MANLLSIAEGAYVQIFPNPNGDNKITREHFISTAKTEYAYQMWRLSKEEKASEGYFNIPSSILSQTEIEVDSNNEASIAGLPILKSIPDDQWIQNIGGLSCECNYVRTNVNLYQIFCDDDSMGDRVRKYLLIGDKIKFLNGTHSKKLTFIYINNGQKVNDRIEIDDMIGKLIRDYLIDQYGGKKGKEDPTSNANSEN